MKLLIIIALLFGAGCASTGAYDLLYEEENTTRKSVTEEDYLPPKEDA